MRKRLLSLLVWIPFLSGTAPALSVDEVIKLKKARVGEATIQMLIEGDGGSRSAGTRKTKDGWIVQTTDTREQRDDYDARYNAYPIAVYPSVGVWRRRR